MVSPTARFLALLTSSPVGKEPLRARGRLTAALHTRAPGQRCPVEREEKMTWGSLYEGGLQVTRHSCLLPDRVSHLLIPNCHGDRQVESGMCL